MSFLPKVALDHYRDAFSVIHLISLTQGQRGHVCCCARGLRADYGFLATMDREIRRDLERDVGYGITDSWDEIVEAMQETPLVTDVTELSQRMT
ncbi:hypothetical protein Tco_0806513 [Tanacetum coccineum]